MKKRPSFKRDRLSPKTGKKKMDRPKLQLIAMSYKQQWFQFHCWGSPCDAETGGPEVDGADAAGGGPSGACEGGADVGGIGC